MTTGDKWFSVRLLLESIHQGDDHALGLFEDQIHVVRAASVDEARQKAEKVAKAKEPLDRYRSVAGDEVSWRFKDILDAKELLDSELSDGTEVYCAHIRREEVDHLRRMLRPFDDLPS